MAEPIPCPFCGHTAALAMVQATDGEDPTFQIKCENLGSMFGVQGCGASGPEQWDRDEAVAAWNRRTAGVAIPQTNQEKP